jgi:uncharacterized protein (DUF1800 family)
LGRAGFGGTPAEVEAAVADGFGATLERVLSESAADVAPTAAPDRFTDATIDDLATAWVARMLGGAAPLRERMTLVWHQHFATSWDKVAVTRLMHVQYELLRQHALGDFRVLLHAIARDPAMLRWLDGDFNVRGGPNENFARELLELFALGVGAYSERDVQEAARALTGWGTKDERFVVRPRMHDDAAKTVFGQTGNFDGDALIDVVLAQPACPRWIARRILVEFVLPDPPSAAVDELALVLTSSDWSIRAAVATVLASELFFSAAARRSRIAAPVELVVRSVRQLDVRITPRLAAGAAARMGQLLFRPPNVKGWEGGRAWIHVGAWIARREFLTTLAEAHLPRAGDASVAFSLRREQPESTADAARMALARLLPGLDDAMLAAIVRTAADTCNSPEDALRLCAALVMTAPEYQLA